MPATAKTSSPTTERVYECVRSYLRRYGRPPTVREIGRALRLSSTSVVTFHLERLVKAGRIARDFKSSRGIDMPDAFTVFIGDEVLVEIDGELVRGRVVEPAQVAQAAA